LASALWWFWWLAGRLEEGEDALERLSANGIADPDLERRVAVARGLVSFRRGSGSERFLGRFADDASSDRWTGEGLHFLAWTRWSESRHDEAIGLCERACTVLEKAGETQDHAQALDSLARMLTRVGRPDEGRRLFEQAIVLFERGDDPGGVGLALTGLADLEEDSGHYARAFALWQDGLDRIRRWGTMPDLAILLVGAAGHAVVQADYGAAEALCDEATRVYAQLALNPVRARCQLAWIFTQQGKYEAAHEVLGSVLAGEYGEVVRSDWRHIAVELAIATGDWDKARREAAAWEIAVSEAGGDGWIRALSGFYSAQFAWLSGDFATAADALTLYVAEVRDRGSNRSLPAALCWLGQSLSEMGRFEDATDAYREALDVGPKFYDNLPDLISLFERIAELLIQTGRARQACTILAAGSRIRADIGTPRHPWQEARHENALSAIRRSISESAFAQAWDEGDSMTIDDAVPCVATALLG
jgi:tetratricopeptide (TPR) repeat protein